MEDKYPVPRISLFSFAGGRFYRNRTVHCLSIKYPCIPAWWRNGTDISQLYKKLSDMLKSYDMETQPYFMKSWDSYKGRNVSSRHGTIYIPNFDEANKILLELFGHTIIESFNRQLIKKNRCVYKNRKVWWCFPLNDKRNVVYRYRSNERNESEHIYKEYRWLFPEDIVFDWGDDIDWKPDYSKLTIGDERKPPLYVCNLCKHEDIKENWNWRTPPGFASHEYISHCPKCKNEGKDIFDKIVGGAPKFSPYMKYQDNYWFYF